MAVDEPRIPTYRELMYPTLVALDNLGGSAGIAELDEEAIEVAGVTDEQLALHTGREEGDRPRPTQMPCVSIRTIST